MDHHEKHEFEHKKEREKEKTQQKHHEQVVAQQESKGYRNPRPFALIVIGIVITVLIVLSWIFFF